MTPAEGHAVIDGVDVDLSSIDADDFEIVEALADVMSAEGADALPAAVRYMRALLGDQYEAAKSGLRAARGSLGLGDMVAFCKDVLEAAGAKNS